MNKRLLKYKCSDFNYNLLNNSHYVSRKYNTLLLNYYWNRTNNYKNTIIFSKKKCKANWYSILQKIGVLDYLESKNINTSKESLNLLTSDSKCKECGIPIYGRTFCSVKCLNLYKSKDETFTNKLSSSLKNYYSGLNEAEKKSKNNKISESIKRTYSKYSKEEFKKFTNTILRRTSFSSFRTRFDNVNFLFDENFFYSNRFLPVECKKCNFKWEITKSTTYSRTECSKCNPKKKHRTQTSLFRYINEILPAKENARNIISNEIDIYVPSLNFGIEYNGLLSHSFGHSKISYFNKFNIDSSYHLNKTNECADKNIELFHIFENEFLDRTKKEIWLSMILSKLGRTNKIHARKCTVRLISSEESKEFLTKNHMQGSSKSNIRLGLFYEEALVQVMTFRTHEKYEWEIARLASLINYTIVGGASKLLNYFKKNYSPNSILSFANRRWSSGNLYEKLGFKFIADTPPNYFYFRVNENILYPREKFQKHKLRGILDSFDESRTEIENMLDNGYRIIYDSGNKKYVKYF